VSLDVPGYQPADDFFHLEPHGERVIPLEARSARARPSGEITALNALARPAIAQESLELKQ
jgi:hypothetical protein